MKKLLLFISVLLVGCTAGKTFQESTVLDVPLYRVWIPEQYIEAEKQNALVAETFLMPIAAIVTEGDSICVVMYGDDCNGIKYEKAVFNNEVKIRLPNLKSFVNLKNHNKHYARKIGEATFYLSYVKDRLLMEVDYNNKITEVYFVDHLDDYAFTYYNSAIAYIRAKYKN